MDVNTEWIYPFFQIVAVMDSKHSNSDLVLSQFPSATDTSRLRTDTGHLATDTSRLGTDTSRLKADLSHLGTDTSQKKADTSQLQTEMSRQKGNIGRSIACG